MEIEKRDIHNVKASFSAVLERLENDANIIPRNKELILNFIRDCRLGKTLKKKQKKVIGEGRCRGYLYNLRRISCWLAKPFDEVTQEDMERFIEDLESDKLLLVGRGNAREKGGLKKLAHSTKVGYKKTLKKFYKWLLGNNDHYPELVEWIETYDTMKEIPSLRREEVEKLSDASKLRDKVIIMFLFDSGARAEEALNIRLGDLVKEGDVYKVRIAHSKTKPRTIHLPICSNYLSMWLGQRDERNDRNFLFPLGYEALRQMISRIGMKVLNKRVTPHVLRHSSVTYYANLIKNPYKLCYRYGWAMSSKMVDRYLDREGIFEEETPQIIKGNDISKLEKQNQTLTEQLSMLKESNTELRAEVENVKKEVGEIYKGKNFMKLLMALVEKRGKTSKAIQESLETEYDAVLSLDDTIAELKNMVRQKS